MAKKIIQINLRDLEEWTEEEIRNLPLSSLRILQFFVGGDPVYTNNIKNCSNFSLDTPEILERLEKRGRGSGGSLAIFTRKSKKEPIIYPILRVKNYHRWVINQKYIPVIEKVLKDLRDYMY